MTSLLRYGMLAVLLMGIVACGEAESTPQTQVVEATVTAELAEQPSTPPGELVPFTHDATGISGLRPENWELVSQDRTFQFVSAPGSPDVFANSLIRAQSSAQMASIRDITFESIRQNHESATDTPPSEVLESELNEDGSGWIVFQMSGPAIETGGTIHRYQGYARSIPSPEGVIISIGVMKEADFLAHEERIREMVDSVHIGE